MKKYCTFLILIVILLCDNNCLAKKIAPKKVKPLIYNQIKFITLHENMGYVQAGDLNSGKLLWKKKIYDVQINPHFEPDMQRVFIKELSLVNGKIIVVNELDDKYELDPKNNDVQKIAGLGYETHQKMLDEGEVLIKKNCLKCHAIDKIERKRKVFDKKRWQKTIRRMIDKGTTINKEEQEVIIKYLLGFKNHN